MKKAIIIILILLGLYWLFDHSGSFPLNHDSLGLHAHNIHRLIGIVCLVIAAIVAWAWKPKQPQQPQM